jgi:hypothetical protein
LYYSFKGHNGDTVLNTNHDFLEENELLNVGYYELGTVVGRSTTPVIEYASTISLLHLADDNFLLPVHDIPPSLSPCPSLTHYYTHLTTPIMSTPESSCQLCAAARKHDSDLAYDEILQEAREHLNFLTAAVFPTHAGLKEDMRQCLQVSE